MSLELDGGDECFARGHAGGAGVSESGQAGGVGVALSAEGFVDGAAVDAGLVGPGDDLLADGRPFAGVGFEQSIEELTALDRQPLLPAGPGNGVPSRSCRMPCLPGRRRT